MPADSSSPWIRDPSEPLPCGCFIEVIWLDKITGKFITDNPGAGEETLKKGCTAWHHDSYRFIKGVGK